MAGLFADFGQTDPSEVRQELMQQQRDQFSKMLEGAGSRKEKAAVNLVQGLQGLGQAGAFGKTVQGHLEQSSPELDKAKAQAVMVKGLSQLEGDKTSADWARRASKLAVDSGDSATGLKFMMEADKRVKTEAAGVAKQQLADDDNRRKLYQAMPEDLQLATVAADPAAAEFFAQVNPSQAGEIQATAKRSLETKLLKEQKSLQDLMSVKTTASNNVTAGQTEKLLSAAGFGGFSFEKWGFKDQPHKFTEFAIAIDQQVLDLMDTAASKQGGGVRLNKHGLVNQFVKLASADGTIELDNDGTINNVKMDQVGNIFKQIEAGLAGQGTGQAAPQSRSQQTGRRVIPYKGN